MDTKTIAIEKNSRIIEDLPQRIGQLSIEHLNTEELNAKYRKDGSFIVYNILPIQVHNDILEVGILQYTFSVKRSLFKRSHRLYALSGDCRVKFRLNVDEQQFEVVASQWGGV